MNDLIIYQNGELELKVSVEENTIWLSTEDIALLFDVQRPAIVKHVGNIYKGEELIQSSTCSILEQVAKDGKKRKVNFYNLDMIISVGYRVNSKKATKFRQWATSILKNYIQNGYAINSEKITQQRLLSLENDVKSIKSHIKDNTIELKQGIFFDGQIFDAYVFISELIKKAKSSIVLIDNHIDESTLTLFSKNTEIDIKIYTYTVSKQLKLDIEKYNTQYKNLKVIQAKNFHDRFLIIDDNEIYHIGASLKDLGKKVFAFSKIDISIEDILKRIK